MRMRFRCAGAMAAMALVATSASFAGESAETALRTETALSAGARFAIENLLGSTTVVGGGEAGRAVVEARVVAEADSKDAARELADSVRLEASAGDAAGVRVAFPVEAHPAFRLPRSEVDGLLSKWVTPLVRKSSVAVQYGGRSVQVGQARGATALSVHVTVTLPYDTAVAIRQVAGSVECSRYRGSVAVESVEAGVNGSQLYGDLKIRTSGGAVDVRSFRGGRLEIVTGPGDVTIAGIDADEASLTTAGGSVRGSRVQVGDLAVDAAEGSVELEGVEPAALAIRAGSGDVDLSTHFKRLRSASIDAESGDVTLRVGTLSRFALAARLGRGEVKAKGVDLEEDRAAGDEFVHYRRGTGGPELRVVAGRGDVTLREN